MKKLFIISALALASLSVSAQYQLANNGFENWEEVSYSYKVLFSQRTVTGNEPIDWNSFLTSTGDQKQTAITTGSGKQLFKEEQDLPTIPGNTACAKLTSVSIFGIVAQGNLTTGCINMGSMSATDASGNYNYVDASHNMSFTGHPDAIQFWIKHTGVKNANVEALLTTAGYFQTPAYSDRNTATLVATAKSKDNASDTNADHSNVQVVSNSTWTQYTIPFIYKSELTPSYALVTVSTCAEPGAGDADDVTYIDDVIMLYYSELADAEYDGNSIEFNEGTATVDAYFDEDMLTLTSNGRAATIEQTYDEETAVLTVNVKGENISEDSSNYHTYTIQFKMPEYTVTWKDYDGTILATTQVTKGYAPEYTGAALESHSREGYTYEFSGWKVEGTKELVELADEVITAPTTYVAEYYNVKGWATKIDENNTQKATKIFRDGQIYILKGKEVFDILGNKIN